MSDSDLTQVYMIAGMCWACAAMVVAAVVYKIQIKRK